MFLTHKDFDDYYRTRFEISQINKFQEFQDRIYEISKSKFSLEFYSPKERNVVESLSFWKSTGKLIKRTKNLENFMYDLMKFHFLGYIPGFIKIRVKILRTKF